MVKFDYNIDIYRILLAVISFFIVSQVNNIDKKLEKIEHLENRIVRIETKLFGFQRIAIIDSPKIVAILPKKKKENEDETF